MILCNGLEGELTSNDVYRLLMLILARMKVKMDVWSVRQGWDYASQIDQLRSSERDFKEALPTQLVVE